MTEPDYRLVNVGRLRLEQWVSIKSVPHLVMLC